VHSVEKSIKPWLQAQTSSIEDDDDDDDDDEVIEEEWLRSRGTIESLWLPVTIAVNIAGEEACWTRCRLDGEP